MKILTDEMSGNRLPEPQQQRLTPGSVLEVSAQGSYDGAFAIMSGAAITVAEISMGEPAPDAPKDAHGQKLYLMHVVDPQDRDFAAIALRAERAGMPASPYVIAAAAQDGGIKGMAYLPVPVIAEGKIAKPAISNYIIGREGTLKWLDFGIEQERKPGWTPFEENRQVARKQLQIAGDGKGHFNLMGLETKSRTQVKAAEVKMVFDGEKERAETQAAGSTAPKSKIGQLALKLMRRSKK